LPSSCRGTLVSRFSVIGGLLDLPQSPYPSPGVQPAGRCDQEPHRSLGLEGTRRVIVRWRLDYNNRRPHSALG